MTRVIDGHVHIWPRDKSNYPPAYLPYHPFASEDGDAAALIELMDAQGISRSIVVQTAWYAEDDRYIEDMIRRYPGRFTGVGCLSLKLETVDIESAARKLGAGRMRGCRIQIVNPESADFARSGKLDRFLRQANDLAQPILVFYRDYDMHDFVESVAAQFRDIPLVVEHMAFATGKCGKTGEYVDRLMALARHVQVHVKLTVHHQLSAERFPWEDLHGLQRRLIDEFGAKRILWGSNFPKFMPDPNYEQRVSALRDHFPFRSDSDRDWVLGGTAEKLWPLDRTYS